MYALILLARPSSGIQAKYYTMCLLIYIMIIMPGTVPNLTSSGRISPHRVRPLRDQETVSTNHTPSFFYVFV